MNAQEAIRLCRYVRAACPAQAMDEFTPMTWADLLSDVRYEDAQEAVRDLAKMQPFIAPAEIRAGVRRIRARRLELYGDPVPPPDLTPRQTVEWLRDAYRRIGDGEDGRGSARGELKPMPGRIRLAGRNIRDEATG